MDILKALILGLVQGFTEFLPVSSSGHIELTKAIFNKVPDEGGMLMTVVLHAATALSTIVVYRKEIVEIFAGLFSFKWNEESQFAVKIIISMFPAAIVGLVFEEQIESLFNENVLLVGIMLIVTAITLLLADKAKSTLKDVTFANALIVGISQAIAILPGISRSGATISTSVLLGIDRQKAAKFSFLMVVPLILGKMAKDLMSGDLSQSTTPAIELGVGFVAAFISGLVACTWMIALVKKSKLIYFSFYCFIVGAIALAYALLA